MSSNKYPSHEAPRVVVRLSPALKRRLKRIADREGRSMNSQVVQMLEKSIREAESKVI